MPLTTGRFDLPPNLCQTARPPPRLQPLCVLHIMARNLLSLSAQATAKRILAKVDRGLWPRGLCDDPAADLITHPYMAWCLCWLWRAKGSEPLLLLSLSLLRPARDRRSGTHPGRGPRPGCSVHPDALSPTDLEGLVTCCLSLSFSRRRQRSREFWPSGLITPGAGGGCRMLAGTS